MSVVLVNFSHPLTSEQLAAVERCLGTKLARVLDVPTQFDPAAPFAEQGRALVDAAGLSGEEWQALPLVVNPPALAVITAVVLAGIHGRRGHFPTVLRLRRNGSGPLATMEVAELIDLQAVREHARTRRR